MKFLHSRCVDLYISSLLYIFFLWEHLSAAWSLILLTVSFVSGVVDSFDSVVVNLYFFSQSLDNIVVDWVLFRFQHWLLSLGVKCVLLASIYLSCRQLPYLGVNFLVFASNVLSSSIVRLLWLVGSCWIYHGVWTIYRSIRCYLCSTITLRLCS